jgi:hypothetical protein
MKAVGKFIAEIQGELFTSAEAREVFLKILPTLNGDTIHGEPFTSEKALFKARLEGTIKVRHLLVKLDQASHSMTQTEANVFLYIVTRDLNMRMEQYLQFAQDQQRQLASDSRLATQVA